MDEPSQTLAAAAAEELFARATAERIVPLEGGLNFRDLGGYRTADGRRVRRGKLYRSGSLSGLTEADCAYVAGLGLRSLCDLRTTSEQTGEPNLWVRDTPVSYWSRDYELSFGDLRNVMARGPSAEEARAAMMAGYKALPYEQAPAYGEIFRRLAEGEMPMVFHCSAGKDRAGTAAALILSALRVPRETVLADYVLSDQLARVRHADREQDSRSVASRVTPEVLRIVLGAEAGYLEAAFEAIEARHGSLEGYLAEVLGVTPAMLQEIRRQLVE